MMPIRVMRNPGVSTSATLTGQSVSQAGITIVGTRSGIRVNTNGDLEARNVGVYSTRMVWLLSGLSSAQEVRVTTPDAIEAGTLNAWVSCDTSPEWTLTDSVVDGFPVTATLTMTIREKATLAATAPVTITLSSDLQ